MAQQAAPLVAIRTREDALSYAKQWEREAERMTMLYDCACILRQNAEALLTACQAECERLRRLLG